jgi:SAM-dependent methyltransferase
MAGDSRMNIWDFFYLLGWTPWDSGITPPEIVSLVEGGRIPPGRALDLGCGTGTNVIYLKQHGFDVAGVDWSARAIAKARQKVKAAHVDIPLYIGNLLDTEHFPAAGPFDFVMDIGVMHIFDDTGRAHYAATLDRVTRSGSYHYAFGFKPGMAPRRGMLRHLRRGPRGMSADDIGRALEPHGFAVLEAHDAGIDANGVSRTGWFLSQKR